MPNKKKQKLILIPDPQMEGLIDKVLKRYRDSNLFSESARVHISREIYHVLCEYISQVNQGIIDENPLAPKPVEKKVLSLTPEEFKRKQEGKPVKKAKAKTEIILKEPVKKMEQNSKRSVQRTRTQRSLEK
tara:strand:+ start:233 stop:625 length:393 start_codon:yes stop_codon:yes gene_type:complete